MSKPDAVPPRGEIVKMRRQMLGLTLREVAERVPCSHSSLSDWENGLRIPRARWGQLARALGTSIASLRGARRS